MEFKGTQGPWVECGNGRGGCKCGHIWSKPADRRVAAIFVDSEGFGTDVPDDQRRANARLIAAAPELLEALQVMVSVGTEYYDMDCGENGGPAIESARAAIVKALGE